MNPLSLITSAVSGIGGAVSKVASTFVGDRAARDAQYSSENIATYGQFASEFQVKNRTWFDSLIDGINRLPRPTITAMVIYYFVAAVRDPIQFQKINISLDTIPENMWLIAFSIISFFFVAREMQKSRDKKMALSKEEFNERMRQTKELDRMQDDGLSEDKYQAELDDTSKPMSNAAIMEWNARNK